MIKTVLSHLKCRANEMSASRYGLKKKKCGTQEDVPKWLVSG